MGYTIEFGNGIFPTSQGSMAGTITDNDTGKVFNTALFCGRNSEKTGTTREGLLYTAKVFEPAITHINGVANLSNEPLGEQLFKNSGLEGTGSIPTNWIANGALEGTCVPMQSVVFPSVQSWRFDVSNGGQRLHQSVPYTNGDKGIYSVYVEDFGGDPIAVSNVLTVATRATNLVFKMNGVIIDQTDFITETGIYSVSFDCTETGIVFSNFGLRNLTGTSNVTLSLPQSETGDKRTSFILSPINATQTRLADTGFKTPNISKWIDYNASKVSFIIKTKPLIANGVRRINLGTSNTITIGILFLNDSTSTAYIKFVVNGVNFINDAPFSADLTKMSEFKIEMSNNKVEVFVDGVSAREDAPTFNLSDIDFSAIYFDRGNGADQFFGETEYVKIES